MPRPTGSKVVPCPKKRCDGNIVAIPPNKGTCSKCGTEVRVTKRLLRELGKL